MNILCTIFALLSNHANACEENVNKEKNNNLGKIERCGNSSDVNYLKIIIPSLVGSLVVGGIISRVSTNDKIGRQDTDGNAQKEIRGLPNPGTACYMISALQLLYDDLEFRKIVLNNNFSGQNKEKMDAVKKIFQHLDGDLNLVDEDIYSLYKQLGYINTQDDLLDCKGQIEELFDRAKITDNKYKCNSVLMYYDIPKDLSKEVVFNNLVNKNDDPKLKEKSIININIYRTEDEQTGTVNKNYVNIPVSLTFGNNYFELVSVCSHIGVSSKNGHYVSYVKRGSMWTKQDDNYISSHNWNDIKNDIGQNCVFLRYERTKCV